MISIIKTDNFQKWLNNVRDRQAIYRITTRLQRVEDGNWGDIKPVGDGVSEMRIDHGGGYRLYFLQCGNTVVVMLGGGDKSSQSRDIKKAKELAKDWR
ncbi:MAG: type II toxin-antitoxin system RelE/ParE family toxin [Rickettsiales bacterium]